MKVLFFRFHKQSKFAENKINSIKMKIYAFPLKKLFLNNSTILDCYSCVTIYFYYTRIKSLLTMM
ncbi:protein of unknown function [Maridesulfovibrio hydrothermalis AM13 = DSM 14728]|uniref:Uncharacterized protein n=1 Tax=Maridesulfovibrio hydrothermalis AM13 = DSM 14728 TaxID=1121451 RepID=L0RC97_9BACT|nr:protein of unknown function [Maridesulfovibrio hydrothermalis AM13 = DSM 14728]